MAATAPAVWQGMSADERDAVVGKVQERHPHLTGEAFWTKVYRVAAIMAHANHGPTWAGRSPQ